MIRTSSWLVITPSTNYCVTPSRTRTPVVIRLMPRTKLLIAEHVTKFGTTMISVGLLLSARLLINLSSSFEIQGLQSILWRIFANFLDTGSLHDNRDELWRDKHHHYVQNQHWWWVWMFSPSSTKRLTTGKPGCTTIFRDFYNPLVDIRVLIGKEEQMIMGAGWNQLHAMSSSLTSAPWTPLGHHVFEQWTHLWSKRLI